AFEVEPADHADEGDDHADDQARVHAAAVGFLRGVGDHLDVVVVGHQAACSSSLASAGMMRAPADQSPDPLDAAAMRARNSTIRSTTTWTESSTTYRCLFTSEMVVSGHASTSSIR